MSPRTGRPPSEHPRNHSVPIRFATDELDAVKTAAERAGKTVGEWCREKLLAAAKCQR